mgnify:CR=1 FL=1
MDLITRYITEPFQYEFIQRALIASLMVGISCGLIGTYIMLRRLSLIGDALAHAVLPGGRQPALFRAVALIGGPSLGWRVTAGFLLALVAAAATAFLVSLS